MLTYKELEEKVEKLEQEIFRLSDLVQDFSQKVQGEGVIILSGNRFKLDKSGAISDYQLKSS
jgi:hypothetical protein